MLLEEWEKNYSLSNPFINPPHLILSLACEAGIIILIF